LRAVAKQVGNGLPIKEQEQDQEQDISPVTLARAGETPTDLLTVDDALQQVLSAGLKLTRPGIGNHRRLARSCPVRRADLTAAITATRSAVNPNWTYLLECLEKPMQTGPPGSVGRHRGSEFTDADDYSGDGPPPLGT
jgi:hypothetical protein